MRKKLLIYSCSGFTLIEMIAVVVIIGVLAGLALPRYFITMERVKTSEGVSILTSLMGAQKRYALENAGTYTNNLANLDVTVPASPNFNAPTVAAADPIASIQRNGGGGWNYTLRITASGTISCVDATAGQCVKVKTWP